MNAILVLYAGNLTKYAFKPLFNGENSLSLTANRAQKFPGVTKTVLLASQGDFSFLHGIEIEQRGKWTKKSLLERISELQSGFDLIYFAFADCPFLDCELAGLIAKRHLEYRAEYSYADGFPYALAPEILSPGTAGILAQILSEDGPVERDLLFSVIQKDINNFDIEVEISRVDLTMHRINLCADTKRNHLLLQILINANDDKIPAAYDIERIAEEKSETLRTLPIFYPIQVYGGCPSKCTLCPYPVYSDSGRKDFMNSGKFESLLDKIIAFSGDAVIDLSLWGELSFHPEKIKLIEAVIKKPELALIIETTGLNWKTEELEKLCEEVSRNTSVRENPLPPLSWIVSLDTSDPSKYTELHGSGFAEAQACVKKLFSLFPNDCYVQAVRVKGSEEDTEKFYRYWKENSPNGEKNIIIQKYDDFCGSLEKKQASDISPVIRQSCWHIMRDLPILIDGNVPLCKEDMSVFKNDKTRILGNVFCDSLETIWKNGQKYYLEQCKKNYLGICKNCDEYYTYNF
ncbi:MAG: spiro-SPASM protein [Treponema sp.]|nr:spiro-SPASM protein [Treponema sp.]MCL2251174.1 spiro-SPASM protein [Treponema sp.]